MPTPARFGIVTYQERVRVPILWWVIALVLALSLDVAVFAYVDLWIAVLFAVFSTAIVVVGLVGYTLRINVTDDVLRAGRYSLEAEYVGDVTAFRGAEADRVLGPGSDKRSFLITRPFLRDVVKVEIDDDADPHSAWLINTRKPDELAGAIRAMQGA